MQSMVEMGEIRVFLALADELHFGHTADRLGLTQSRVSQLLRSLENKLGDPLLRRTSRRVSLTPAGARLLRELGPAYNDVLSALEHCRRASEQLEGVLRLGVTSASAVHPALLDVIETFEAEHPRCRAETVELPFRDRLSPLQRGEIELMVARLPLDEPQIVLGPVVSTDQRVLAVAKDHPLAARGTTTLDEIAEYPVLDLADIYPRRTADAYVPAATPAGRPLHRAHLDVTDISDLVILIARGRIVQPTVASAASRFAHPNIICIPISDLPPSRAALAWRRRDPDPRLRAFIAIARQHLRRRTARNPA
jgi:DNA-binding transcriptional LysR family regulator